MLTKHNSGFTLQELFIVIAIIGIVGVVIASAFTSPKAGAATPDPIVQYLQGYGAEFIYSDGTLTLYNRGSGLWETSAEACQELNPLTDDNLRLITTRTLADGKWITEIANCN